jgi:hypothetical protein
MGRAAVSAARRVAAQQVPALRRQAVVQAQAAEAAVPPARWSSRRA